jgi:hypothetical protein
MTDIGDTVSAKSDQLNADDLMGGNVVITITRVVVGNKTDDQPVSIYHDWDPKKPYKPSKGMRRVLIAMWGNTSADYVGRQLGLYRDPKVRFGADEVGGIRIGAASHISGQMKIMIQVKKGQKAGHVVKPLQNQQRGGGQQREQQQERQPDPEPASNDRGNDEGGFDAP